MDSTALSHLGAAATAAPMSDFFTAPATLSPSSLTFDSQNLGTSSASQPVTLTNTQSTELSISSIAISGDASGEFSETDNCGTTLAAGASCTINVTFSPAWAGARNATLTVTDSANNSPQATSLSGTGIYFAASLSPTFLSFASQQVGTTSPVQVLTLTNNSVTGPLSISSIAVGGDFQQTNNCGSSLAIGSSCTIDVTFTPSASGTRTSILAVTDNATDSPQTAILTGTGATVISAPLTTAWGAFSDSSATASSVTSGSFLVPSGGLIVAYCGTSTSVPVTSTISDTAANTFVQVGTTVQGSGSDALAMYYAASANASSSDSVTCNWSSAHHTLGVTVLVYSGADLTAPLDASATGYARGATSIQTGAFSTSSTDEIIVAGMISGSGCIGAPTAGSGYTMEILAIPSGCAGPVAAAEDAVVSTLQTNATASMTFPSAIYGDMIVATFRAASTVSLSPRSLTFASQQVGATSAAQSVTLTNTQSAPLTISSVTITGTNTADFSQTNNCGTSLAAGASCTINVNFNPAASGARSATLTVTDNALGSPQTVSLTGTGTVAAGLASVQVRNNIDTSGTYFTSFSVNITTQPGDLLVAFCRAGGTGTDNFTVTDSAGQTWTQTSSGYKNESDTGPRVGMFYMANSAAVTSVTVHYSTSGGVIKPGIIVMEISGAATSGVPDGSVNHASLASVATSSSGSLTTTNAYDVLVFATDTSGNETSWTAGTGYAIPNNNVTTGASASNIRMAMQYAIASSVLSGATTSMSYAGSNWNGNIFAAFKGVNPPPSVSLLPTSLAFPSQTVGSTSTSQKAVLFNESASPVSISSISITGANAGDFTQTNNCGTSLAGGANRTINVSFTPGLTGAESAVLTVTDNAANSPQTASLAGTGSLATAAPIASLSPAVVAFGNENVGTTTPPQAVTLSNSGNAPLNTIGIAISGTNSGDFAQTNNCGASLAPGANCTINVTFTPSATGARSGSVTVTDNASDSPQTASLTGTGTAFDNLAESDIDALFASSGPATPLLTAGGAWLNGSLNELPNGGFIPSAAYSLGNGNYLYLYQISDGDAFIFPVTQLSIPLGGQPLVPLGAVTGVPLWPHRYRVTRITTTRNITPSTGHLPGSIKGSTGQIRTLTRLRG